VEYACDAVQERGSSRVAYPFLHLYTLDDNQVVLSRKDSHMCRTKGRHVLAAA